MSADGEVMRPVELLNHREESWSRKAAAVSLIAECDVNPEFTEQALGVLGQGYRVLNPKGRAEGWLRRWPAVHVMSTVLVATEHYSNGTFWPRLSELAGVAQDQQFQRAWGQAFLHNLEQLGLPRFEDVDDAGSTYVGRILLHSGVPTYCLPDFFTLVEERRRRTPGLSADAFVAWASSRPLPHVDKPVARFLKYGGEFAVDVVDRVFDLLDIASVGGNLDEVPLPDRFRQAALELAQAGSIARRSRRSASGLNAGADRHPRLFLDPFGRGLLLRLPAVSEAPDGTANWVVGMDGVRQRVATKALWPGSGEPAPPTDVSVRAPVRSVSAALESHGHLAVTLPVVDERDPLLAFDEEGTQLVPGVPWRVSTAWLLFPGQRDDLSVTGTLHVLTEASLPPGWVGWSLIQVDLTHVTSISHGDSAKAHPVRRAHSARIVVPTPIGGVRTRTGDPVFTAPPHIDLPPELGPDVTWEVSIVNGRGELLARRVGLTDPDQIWSEIPRPLFGAYALKVRGPWGRSASRDLVIVEGLTPTFSPVWRRFQVQGGLVPCEVRIDVNEAMHCDSASLSLDSHTVKSSIAITRGADSLHLSVEPAHMSVTHQSTQGVTGPTVQPPLLYTEDLAAEPGVLILSVGASAAPLLHVFDGKERLQVVEPGADARHGLHRFDLRKITDTMLAHPQLRLCVDPEGILEIANIRPHRLFSGLRITDGVIVLDDCVNLAGLTVIAYATRAPWRSGVQIPVSDGHASLPAELVQAGPLVVSVRVEDPWLPEPVPAWAQPGEATIVYDDGHLISADTEETALSAYLADMGPVPSDLKDLGRVWSTLARLDQMQVRERTRKQGELARLLAMDVSSSLIALTSSALDAAERLQVLIDSKLAAAPVQGAPVQVADLDWSRQSLVMSVLLLGAVDPAAHQQAIEEAVVSGGDLLRLAALGKDPAPQISALGPSHDLYDSSGPDVRAALESVAAFVPQGVVDPESRRLATFEFLKTRHDHNLGLVIPPAEKLLAQARVLFTRVGDPDSALAVDARSHPTNPTSWRTIPQLSMAFACGARHAAHGSATAAGWIDAHRRAWSQIVRACPDLVAADLILAELMINPPSLPDLEEAL
ncbi:hypothetical protein AFL01nite_18560 [Aeromicrobium flavum]|uniref:Uncharacterized protein n=2 Tax=Aeromicrobium flavum TaxID=416568 RepID=A0A512HVQ1_9ACTN|nr:hypothetical protein AFL01nite_18560 [Aeromicrobium flavum]